MKVSPSCLLALQFGTTVTNLEYHFNITEQVWGKGATIAPNAFNATMVQALEEYLALDQTYKTVDEWLNAWNVWLAEERTNVPIKS